MHNQLMLLEPSDNFLLYGDSGDGKTALLGEIAEHVFATTGKKTRIVTCDDGGTLTIQPYIDLGVVETVEMVGDPWVWLHHVVRGHSPDQTGSKTVWRPLTDDIGFIGFESMTSVSDYLMLDLAAKAAKGLNIGGGGAYKFSVGQGTEALEIGANNISHYGVVQNRILEEVRASQTLPVPIGWTAAVRRASDNESNSPVLGPQIAGKAATADIPRRFKYTFRVAAIPPATAKERERHVLYLGDHIDRTAANAKGLGNSRNPLAATPLPREIEPASLVEALRLIKAGQEEARGLIESRLGLAKA